VLIPIAKKDMFNGTAPKDDSQFADRVTHPELAKLLPALYPGVFPTLAAYTKARADLAAIFLTGLPAGVVPNFQNNTGTVQAELLRLNLAIPPTAHPNIIGLIAGDAAGFPNGRRLEDDVVTIELRALAGATIPLVDKTYVPDNAVGALSDFATQTNGAFLPTFPYLGTPNSGFATKPKNHDTGGGAGSTPVGGAAPGRGAPPPGAAPSCSSVVPWLPPVRSPPAGPTTTPAPPPPPTGYPPTPPAPSSRSPPTRNESHVDERAPPGHQHPHHHRGAPARGPLPAEPTAGPRRHGAVVSGPR